MIAVSGSARQLLPEQRQCAYSGALNKHSALPAIPRVTPDLMKKYLSLYDDWGGWVMRESIFFAGLFSKAQHAEGLFGDVGEIGVHHGKFTIPIALYASPSERILAADLFQRQAENVDKSGRGDEAVVRGNLADFGLTEATTVLEINSLELTGQKIANLGFHGFRYLSVDGGHTHDLTLNDLLFSCEVIVDGGIVALDDFVNDFLGVASGAFTFIRTQARLVPFLWAANKLYFTTVLHAPVYQSVLKSFNPHLCANKATYFARERQIFGRPVCVVKCNEKKVHAACGEMRDALGKLYL